MRNKCSITEIISTMLHAKLRSFLAILGVVVGTASVVALMSSSQLATHHALAQFESLGTHLLAMDIQSDYDHPTEALPVRFTQQDLSDLHHAEPDIQLIAPYVSLYEASRFQGIPYQTSVLGVTPEFIDIAQLSIDQGRFISYLDGANYYCMIGSRVASAIQSQGVNPLGKQILVGKNYFTIIGILKKWTSNLFIYADVNNSVITSLPATYAISIDAQVHNVLFRLTQNAAIAVSQQHIKNKMTELYPTSQINFRNPLQIIAVIGKQRQTFSWLLSAIGGISLLVGGIGVMNIMLVSVIERRREIGIRMAIGASQQDILIMFLLESVVLTVFGGVVGIVFGVLISWVIAHVSGWAFFILKGPLLLGFFVSVLVGILSGFFPALNASRLDPVRSLGAD